MSHREEPAVVPRDLFSNDSANLEDYMIPAEPVQEESMQNGSVQTNASEPDAQSAPEEASDADRVDLRVCTISGAEHILSGLPASATIAEVKSSTAALLGVLPFSVRLLHGDDMLLEDGARLSELGLAHAGASVTVLRCAANRAEWAKLFADLRRAIYNQREDEARALVDQGAGFDGDGNILRELPGMWCPHRPPGEQWSTADEPGNTMLHLAIRQGLTRLALYLLSKGASVNAKSACDRTALIMAIIKRQYDIIDVLLEAKADVTHRDYVGHTALTYALRSGMDDVAARLVTSSGTDFTPAAEGSSAMQSSFAGLAPDDFTSDFKVDEVVLSGIHPVLTCCACGLPLTAHALLTMGASANNVDANGAGALYYACRLDEKRFAHSRETLIAMLVEKGAAESLSNTTKANEMQSIDEKQQDQSRNCLHASKLGFKSLLQTLLRLDV